MTTVEWVACSALTGVVIADLPGLQVDTIEQVLMGYATASAVLPIEDSTTPEWRNATLPGGVFIVMLEDETPTWGAMVTQRKRGANDSVVLGLATVETYFRRRYVGDETFAATDQCEIVEMLVTNYAADSLALEVSAEASAYTRDRTYVDDDDKTLYSVLSELSGVINGPEWTVTWGEYTVGTQRAYKPILVVADRLGSEPAEGMAPAVTFDLPGTISEVLFTEDYSDGSGANDVMATSTAVNNERPESAHATSADGSRPTFELRFSPSTSITETDTLDAHAEARLARVEGGSLSLELTLIPREGSRPGIDFFVGDTIGFHLGHDAAPLPNFPGGLSGTARVTGWKRSFGDVDKVTPVLTSVEVD